MAGTVQRAKVTPMPENRLHVEFSEPVPAITPGQVLGMIEVDNGQASAL